MNSLDLKSSISSYFNICMQQYRQILVKIFKSLQIIVITSNHIESLDSYYLGSISGMRLAFLLIYRGIFHQKNI
jgi:hypothetical protein